MKPTRGSDPAPDDAVLVARQVWAAISDLVLDHERRREVSEAIGLSFNRIRAVRRLARQPMSMRELAELLGIDPPNATTVVDDLESRGLVRRRPHPTDRRAKLVEATAKGKAAARKANDILGNPPPQLVALGTADLEKLLQILRRSVSE